MNYRLMLAAAVLALLAPAAADAQVRPYENPDSVIDFDRNDPAYDGAARGATDPTYVPEDINDITPENVMNSMTDEEMEEMSKLFEEHYGSSRGPMEKLDGTKAEIQTAKDRVESYSMTFQEREAGRNRLTPPPNVAAEPEPEPAPVRKPVYHRENRTGTTPPRLFNNVD